MSDCDAREYEGDNVVKFKLDEASDPVGPNKPKRFGESSNGEGKMCIQMWDLNDGCFAASPYPACPITKPAGILEDPENKWEKKSWSAGPSGGPGDGSVSITQLEEPTLVSDAPLVIRAGKFQGKDGIDIILEQEDGTVKGISLLELQEARIDGGVL